MASLQVIIGAATPSATDSLIEDYLIDVGHSVTFVDDDTAENTTGFDGVLIADSCATGSLGTKYVSVALPVLLHEGFYVDTMGMTSSEGAVAELNTQMVIADATHPWAVGPYGTFSGTVTVYSSSAQFTNIDDATTDFGAGVDQMAEAPSATTRKVAFSYESGATMSSGPAPAKRGYITYRDVVGGAINDDGIKMLKNAYVWAFGAPESATVAWIGA